MPLLNDLVPNDSLLCKLWRIDDSEDIMDPNNELNSDDYQIFLSRKANHMKRQFLASRKLIALVDLDLRVTYKNNIPILSDNRNISISHSESIATILISEKKGIGIDIERINKKVHSIKSKFLNQKEINYLRGEEETRMLTKAWTAKEAIYKALRKPGIIFSRNILLEEFNNEAKSGIGKFISSDQETIFKLYFYDLDDYCLTISEEV
ncbi:MAG: 4'-phosphopantetheinyl transferase superfamily protein [Pelagibacterales bacterium]|nr:4'-phosphopantetheinyl transferase superfamily protein [Pelagibacterales bacterium]